MSGVPDHPRLRADVRIFRSGDDLIVRSELEHFKVEGPARRLVELLVPLLDGRSVARIAMGSEAGFAILQTLADFGERGLLTGDEPPRPRATARGPDFDTLEAIDRAARKEGWSFRWAFALAGEIVAGRSNPGGPCFSCFQLRWLAIRKSVEHEVAFLQHLRAGGWRDEGCPDAIWIANARDEAGGEVTVTSLRTRKTSRHPLIPHGGCPACGPHVRPRGGLGRGDWHDSPIDLFALERQLRPLADDRLGVVSIEPTPPERLPEEPGLPYITLTRFSFPKPFEVGGKQTNLTHGSAKTPAAATAIALIEALERYTGLTPVPADVIAPQGELTEAIWPPDLPLFSDAQYAQPGFPFRRFDPKEPIGWVKGFSLRHERPLLIPLAAAYYGERNPLLQETSSGVAAHSARSEALRSAVSELVERDAFFIHWLNRLSPPRVRIEDSSDPFVQQIHRYVERKGWSLIVADLTTDLRVPVFLAIGVRDDRRGHALLLGAGAAMDPAVALERALEELYSAVVCQPLEWIPPERIGKEAVIRSTDHQRYYAHPEDLDRARFLWASPKHLSPPGPKQPDLLRPHLLFDRLHAEGLEVIGVDLTVSELAGRGLLVVRAIVPGLQPLAFGPTGLRLGGRRLYEVPVRMGHLAQPLREEELNPEPHCFP